MATEKQEMKSDVHPSEVTMEAEKAAEQSAMPFRLVDANGLALMCFAFSTLLFFAFMCNLAESSGDNNGVFYMGDMLTWGVSVGLVTAAVVQGLQGDNLGFTSYLLHAAVLGTIGHSFKMSVDLGANAGPFHVLGFLCYATAWFDCIFAVLAFRVAKMFGVLYCSVALMFLFVGLNFQKVLSDGQDPTDRTGDYVAGVFCLLVSVECLYLMVPVLTGVGKIV